MKRIVISILSALVAMTSVCALAGCGSNSNGNTSSAASQSSAQESAAAQSSVGSAAATISASDAVFTFNGVNVVEKTVKDNVSNAVKLDREAGRNRSFYCYCFNPDIPGEDNPGTFHSVDLWFWFESLGKCWRPLRGRHFDLARKMANYFTNFIKTGNPNGKDNDGADMPEWRKFDPEERNVITFETDVKN